MKKLLAIVVLLSSTVFAQNADSVSVRADSLDSSVATSTDVTELKLSPLNHLGHNMLLSAFGWPLGFHMLGGALTYKLQPQQADPAQGHHRPAILRRHQRRRAQRENLSLMSGSQPCGPHLCVLFGTQPCVPMKKEKPRRFLKIRPHFSKSPRMRTCYPHPIDLEGKLVLYRVCSRGLLR